MTTSDDRPAHRLPHTPRRVVRTFSRRHIDLGRLAGALCPARPNAAPAPRTA